MTEDASGDTRFFWNDSSAGNKFVREYDSFGHALTGPKQLSPQTAIGAIAGLPDGSFDSIYSAGPVIFVQRYDGTGTGIGAPVLVCAEPLFGGIAPTICAAADSNGDLVIVITDYFMFAPGSVDSQVYVATLSASGATTGPVSVDPSTAYQRSGTVAIDGSGAGVVAWLQPFGNAGIFGRQIAGAGATLGPQFTVYQGPTEGAVDAAVDAQGDFTLAYEGAGGIHAQLYNRNGTSVTGDFKIYTFLGDSQVAPLVAMSGQGWSVVAWNESSDGSDDALVEAQVYDPQGRPQGTPFSVPSSSLPTTLSGLAFGNTGKVAIEFNQIGLNDPSHLVTDFRLYRVDQEPVFGGPYHFTVTLGSAAGTVVGTVAAVDPDGDSIYYRLKGSSPFAVDSSSGQITVVDASALKSTSVAQYDLTIQGDDGDQNANQIPVTNVTITVVDPTPPKLKPMPNWTIDAGESVVPLIQATDPAGAALTFSAAVGGGAKATATVNGNNVIVTPAAGFTGTIPVTITAANGLVSSSTSFQVTVVAPTLAPVADLKVHGPASVNLLGSDASGSALTYSAEIISNGSAAAPATLAIDNNVLSITPNPGYVGTFMVTAAVIHGPDTASQTFRVTVVQAETPIISWASPADIVAGTPLSALQLDATASISGTFTYTPALGTVLNAGSGQVLAVTFTPTDTSDYVSVTGEAHINVKAPAPPPVTVIGVAIATVHLTKKKTATDIVITFSGALDAADAGIVANFHLAAPGKGKKAKTYSKPIGLKSATYGSSRVTLQLNGKLALSPAPQLRITASGILDALGRPLDGNGDGQPGGDYVALLTKTGAHPAIVPGAAKFVLGSGRYLIRR